MKKMGNLLLIRVKPFFGFITRNCTVVTIHMQKCAVIVMSGREEKELKRGEKMDFAESCVMVADLITQAFPLALAFAIGQKLVRSFFTMAFGGKNIDI